MPAYWLALTVLAIWPGSEYVPLVFSDHWWVYYGFMQDLRVPWSIGGIGAMWSLCVEVQFYILLPFYAMALSRAVGKLPVASQMRFEGAFLALLATASCLYAYGPVDGPMTEDLPDVAPGKKARLRAGMWAESKARHDVGRIRAVEVRGSDYMGPGVSVDAGHIARVAPAALAGKSVRVIRQLLGQ